MTRSVLTLFSTPLYLSTVNAPSKEIYKHLTELEFKKHDSAIALSNDAHVLDHPILKPLRDQLVKEFNIYKDDILEIDDATLEFDMVTSWVTKSAPGDYSDLHNHRNSLISGVMYLNVPKNSGNITFNEFNNNRMFYQMMDIPFKNYNLFNSANWSIVPEQYQVLFFPSVLLHQVGKNMSDQTRYSLAFNFFPKGKLGTYLSELEIK